MLTLHSHIKACCKVCPQCHQRISSAYVTWHASHCKGVEDAPKGSMDPALAEILKSFDK